MQAGLIVKYLLFFFGFNKLGCFRDIKYKLQCIILLKSVRRELGCSVQAGGRTDGLTDGRTD